MAGFKYRVNWCKLEINDKHTYKKEVKDHGEFQEAQFK